MPSAQTQSVLKARQAVYDTLLPLERTTRKRILIDERLHQQFSRHNLSEVDRRFATYLAMGIVRNWLGLEQLIGKQSRFAYERLQPPIRLLLKVGIFQLLAMDSVPDYAALSTTLDLAGELALSSKARGLMSAILHAIQRTPPPMPSMQDNCPTWLLEMLQNQYDADTLTQILATLGQTPVLAIRVNTLKISIADYRAALEQAGIAATPTEIETVFLLEDHQGDIRQLPGFAEGWFYIQDPASAAVSCFLAPEPGERVLDIGAAPGSKTTHLAAIMANQGHITAVDSSEKRMARLLENIQRLGIQVVEPVVQSGESLELGEVRFDRVLLDAPCSGTGTLGKHPEILLTLQPEELKHYAARQLLLLEQAFTHLRPNGALVYSTCSILAQENQQVIEAFLQRHESKSTLLSERQILPSPYQDGFYMAKLTRREE